MCRADVTGRMLRLHLERPVAECGLSLILDGVRFGLSWKSDDNFVEARSMAMRAGPTDLEAVGWRWLGSRFGCWGQSIKMVGHRIAAYEVLAFSRLTVVTLLVVRGLWRGELKAMWRNGPGVRWCARFSSGQQYLRGHRTAALTLSLFYIWFHVADGDYAACCCVLKGTIGVAPGLRDCGGFVGSWWL